MVAHRGREGGSVIRYYSIEPETFQKMLTSSVTTFAAEGIREGERVTDIRRLPNGRVIVETQDLATEGTRYRLFKAKHAPA